MGKKRTFSNGLDFFLAMAKLDAKLIDFKYWGCSLQAGSLGGMRVMKSWMLFLLASLIACGGDSGEKQSVPAGKLSVVCTTGMVADLARNIGGERVAVVGLMGPGVDPHYYKASQGDLDKLGRADLILYNGLHLEGKMQEIFQKMARKKKVVPVAQGISPEELRRPSEFEGNFDPHIWFDVSLWKQTVATVVESLGEVDPDGVEHYRQNGAIYKQKLEELHLWVRAQMEQIRPEQRILVTAHDAFGYFGQAYGIEVLGLQGISTVAEYGVNDVNRLVDLIVSRKVKAIFVESSVPQRSIEAVQEGCRGRGLEVEIGGTLYSDAMGGPDSEADSYIGMVQSNVSTISTALK
jgi:manganese/zinc/iron transport system substrate-binding protein